MERDITYLNYKVNFAEEKGQIGDQIIWLVKLIDLERSLENINKILRLIALVCNNNQYKNFLEDLQNNSIRFNIVSLIKNILASDYITDLDFPPEKLIDFIFRFIEKFIAPKDWFVYLDLVDN